MADGKAEYDGAGRMALFSTGHYVSSLGSWLGWNRILVTNSGSAYMEEAAHMFRSHRRLLRGLALLVVVAAACGALLARPHLAQASGPTISVTGYIAPTAPITILGGGYSTQDATVNVYLDTTLLGTTRILPMGINGQNRGLFFLRTTVPADTAPGAHVIKTIGQTTGSTVQLSILVRQNWSEFSFISSGGRYNPYESVISPANVSTLVPGWTVGQSSYGHAAPVLVNGVIYDLSDNDGHYTAIDAASGTILWWYLSVNPIDTPVVANGVIYFATGYSRFQAASAATGSMLWSYTLPVSYNYIRNPPVLANGHLYFGDSGGNVYSLTTSGALAWKTTLPGQVGWSGPAVVGGTLYVGTVSTDNTGSLYALDASSGAVLWSGSDLGGVGSVPTVADGTVYVGGQNGEVAAFNAAGCGQSTCSPLWSYTTGAPVLSSPAVANGVVYIGSEDDNLYAFSAAGCGAATCEPLWKATTGGMIDSSPAVANGVVYVGSDDYNVYALPAAGCGAATCAPLWSYKIGYQVWSSPFVANGVLYLGGSDGILYSFVPSGSQHLCQRGVCSSPKPARPGR
jgi:outer membrane protein assembly factor BamB